MSVVAQLVRLPQYARNLARLRHVTAVAARHGFGHWLVRIGLDRYAGLVQRGLVLAEPDSEVNELTWEHRVRLVLEALGPTFIKLGQVAATRPDLIPMSLIHELRKLQDRVGGFPFEQAKLVVEAELGMPLERAFASFDPVPIAAASIAQVHRARLHTGEDVVVKVQRPQLDQIISADLELLSLVAQMLEDRVPEARQFRPKTMIDEFARNLRRETDFGNELQNLERYRKITNAFPELHLPITYPALSGRRILTMEFIDGCKVNDKAKLDEWGVSGEMIARVGTQLFITSIFEHGFFHADPHPGNFFIQRNGQIALIDFGSMGSIDGDTLDELLTFLVSLLLNDPEMLVNQFVDLGLVEDTVNTRALQGEVAEILQRYNGITLDQLDIAVFITEVFETVVRYNVQLPVELILIGKAISTMEGIAQDVYPAFNPLESVRPYLVQLYVRRVLDPKNYSKRIFRVLNDYWGLARVLPGEVRGLLKRAKSGDLQLRLHDQLAEYKADRQERMLNRILLAGYSVAAWSLFTWVLPQALAKPGVAAMDIYAILLATQGVITGGLVLVSWLRSRAR